MPCPFRDKITEFEMNLLGREEADAVAEHLLNSGCSECAAEMRENDKLEIALAVWGERRRSQST
jgi:hypothetical protein